MFIPKTKRSISRIIPFGIIWLIFSIVYTLLEKGLLGNLTYYPATGNPYHFSSAIFLTPTIAFITGLCIGTFEIFLIGKWFSQMSFGKKIFFKSAIYLIMISLFLVITTALSNYIELNTDLFNEKVWDLVWAFFFTYTFLSVVFYVASIILVSQFYAEVSENVGLGVLRNFFTGKYHKPV